MQAYSITVIFDNIGDKTSLRDRLESSDQVKVLLLRVLFAVLALIAISRSAKVQTAHLRRELN